MSDTTTEPRTTSWSAESDARWNLFRTLVQQGMDPDAAADRAGLERA